MYANIKEDHANIDRIILHDSNFLKPDIEKTPLKVSINVGSHNGYIVAPYIKVYGASDIVIDNFRNSFWEYILHDERTDTYYSVTEQIVNDLTLFSTTISDESLVGILQGDSGGRIQFLINAGFIINGSTLSHTVSTKINAELLIELSSKYEVLHTVNDDARSACVVLREKKTKKDYLLKYLKSYYDSYEKEIFNREFVNLKKIGIHQNIYKLVDFNLQHCYGITEFIEGLTIADYIMTYRLSLDRKKEVISDILKVCTHIHSLGFLHGDIHAEQFIVQQNGHLKICDLGLSFDVSKDDPIISSGGAYHYLEPENINANPYSLLPPTPTTLESEIYRIGILMYYIIYETYPFDALHWGDLYTQITCHEPHYPSVDRYNSRISPEMISIIKRCLSKQPQKRYPTLTSLKDALKRAINKDYNGVH